MRLSNEVVLYILVFISLSPSIASRSQAATISVHFDKDVYVVSGPGEAIEAHVLIDTNLATPQRDDPVRGGLFSQALRVDFSGAKAQFTGPGDVTVPPALDYFGFSPNSFRDMTANFAGVKGNIDQLANPLVPYGSSFLATFRITNLASGPDSYPLMLDFFRTVGPNEQMFLSGDGTVLDPEIMFIPSRVIVLPEPASIVPVFVAMVWFVRMFRFRYGCQ